MEEWDRAAFVATHAINANPYLKRFVDVRNPLAAPKGVEYQRVNLEDVEALQ